MDIGTAKPTEPERGGIPHHMLDVVRPDEDFNAALYREMAEPIVRDIARRGRVGIVVGGTGLYIQALTGGIFDCPPSDPSLRRRILAGYDAMGPEASHSRLRSLDPEAASRIHPNDRVRVSRALEIIHLTGRTPTSLAGAHGFEDRPFRALYICLALERRELYRRIDMRSVRMAESGLVEETRALLAAGLSPDLKPMKSLGYRHMVAYLEGRWSLREAVETLQRDTRRYAKRQITWFRRVPGAVWMSPGNFEAMLAAAERHLEQS